MENETGFQTLQRAAMHAAFMCETCRQIPNAGDRLDTAEEMIDRFERRGDLTVEEAASLYRLAVELFGGAHA